MGIKKSKRFGKFVVGALAFTLSPYVGTVRAAPSQSHMAENIWGHQNLIAFEVGAFDAVARTPEERAQMLSRLALKQYAYLPPEPPAQLDESAEIEAMQRQGIDVVAWRFPADADDPRARKTLDLFKLHHIHPQLWINQSYKGVIFPVNYETMTLEEKHDWLVKMEHDRMPKGAQENAARVRQEVNRISALVKLAAPYGCKVELYNHNGWFGAMDNQLAIIKGLKIRGVGDVGIVYNFGHARDEFHDDTRNFAPIWKQIKPHVVAITITGTHREELPRVYPSQGDSELEMMKIIQESGWRGSIGLITENGGDAELTLKNDMIGLDWLAAELNNPSAAGPRPFPVVK